MKTTIDIPDDELAEAMRHAKASTKRAAVVAAVADYNRRQRLARLAARLGTFPGVMTREELANRRAAD